MSTRLDERSVVGPFLLMLGVGLALLGVGFVLYPKRKS